MDFTLINITKSLSLSSAYFALAGLVLLGLFIRYKYKKWREGKLINDFRENKINVRSVKKRRSHFLMKVSIGTTKEDLEEKILTIAEILDSPVIEIERVRRGVFKLCRQTLPSKTGHLKGSKTKIPLAVNKKNKVRYWHILTEMLFICSPTRSGKSTFALAILLKFIEMFKGGLKIIIIDYKRGADFSCLEYHPNKNIKVEIYDPNLDIDKIIEIMEEYNEKTGEANELRRKLGADNDMELGQALPYIPTVFFFDEIERYLTPVGCDKELGEKRKKLIKLFDDATGTWASSVVNIIAATQSPRISDLKIQSVNFLARFFGHTSKESLGYFGINKKFANKIEYRHGKGLLQTSDQEAEEVRTIYYGTNKDLLHKYRGKVR